jgi:PDZ domain-containing protein
VLRVLVVIAVVVAAAVYVASRIQLNYYAITPGHAQPVGPLIAVPPTLDHPVTGRLLLTDVYLTQVSALAYIPDKLSDTTQVVTSEQILGPATPPDQLTAQGYLEMAQSQAAAKSAALGRIGYHVGEKDGGALVFGIVPGSPATRVLKVAQIITAVDGSPTPDACDLVADLHNRRPGQVVELTVEKSTVTAEAVIRPGPIVTESVRLDKVPPSDQGAVSACPGVSGPAHAFLGIEPTTQQDFTFPVHVGVNTSDIGGPSAGLAMTLGIIDKLWSGRLTGGQSIAATGTIEPTGRVGPVGGVAEKTVAVERAGASAFLVPVDDLPTAESKDVPSLRVYAVSSLDQALSILRRLGGDVPPADAQPPSSRGKNNSGR